MAPSNQPNRIHSVLSGNSHTGRIMAINANTTLTTAMAMLR